LTPTILRNTASSRSKTGSHGNHSSDNPVKLHSLASSRDAERPIEADFWTDENKMRWTGSEASKQIPGINSQSAAGVRDAHKKLLGRFVRNHCE
jgi:hypothetical protein